MNSQNEICKGYFLELTPLEEKDLLEFLQEKGFTPDKAGIKDFLLTCVYPEDAPHEISPEMERLIAGGLTAVGNFLKKKAGL
jgi:hypothetical protein